jgi:hypothetical protein
MRTRRLVVAITLTAIGLSGEAAADEDAVYFIGGFGTPVGISGIEGVHLFGSTFELAIGVGLGFAALASSPKVPNAVQWAAMPRLHIGDGHNSFTVGAGISGGEVRDSLYVIWANIEIGGEVWSSDGLALRYFAGYGHGFANGDDFNIPYVGGGIGYHY